MYSELLNSPEIEERWHAKLFNLRAVAYFISQQYQEAISDLNQIIEGDPDNSFIHFLIIMAYLNLGNTDNALTELQNLFNKDREFIIHFMDLMRIALENMGLLKNEK